MFVKDVNLINFPEFDEVDLALIEKSFERFFSKVSSKGERNLSLSLKNYSRGGLKTQHEVHAKLLLDGVVFVASTKGWQLMESIQNALKKIEKEVQKSTSKLN